jgi:hypothetical protein
MKDPIDDTERMDYLSKNNFASDEKGASMHIGRARTQEQAICTTLYF